MRTIDLAVIGGGAAGTAVADAVQRAHADWSTALFERSNRIGGRLRSVRLDGLDHPIELGGMRYLTSQPRVGALVERFALATHPFDATGGADRSVLRSVVAAGAEDVEAGRGYDLAPEERGRSAGELIRDVFERIVPGFRDLDGNGFIDRRATARYLDRPITDWSIGEVLAGALSPEAHRFVVDAFGYDSGLRAFNAPDFIEFVFSGGDPSTEARTPDDGMDRIPRELAANFTRAGGEVLLAHELVELAVEDGRALLRFANGQAASAARVVLTMPVPALRLLAAKPLLAPVFERVLDAVEPFPAMKLYLTYDQPWWRPSVAGVRTTTDNPIRKSFYFDGRAGERSALLAMYTDGRHVEPWIDLHGGARAGAPAPAAFLAAAEEGLRAAHPEVAVIPPALGSALMYWGADPHETGWHFWRGGARSDDILELAPQPDPALPIFLAGEAFSRHQSWVEGALEAADAVVERLLEVRRS